MSGHYGVMPHRVKKKGGKSPLACVKAADYRLICAGLVIPVCIVDLWGLWPRRSQLRMICHQRRRHFRMHSGKAAFNDIIE